MKMVLFVCSFLVTFLATINLQAWSWFGTTPSQTIEKVALATTATPLTPVDGTVEVGLNAGPISYSPDGRFAAILSFDTTTGAGTVFIYSVDSETGALTPVQTAGTGFFPDTFGYSPCGSYAAVANSGTPDFSTPNTQGSITVYRVHSTTGEWSLRQTIPDSTVPTGVVYSPDGRFVAVTDFNGGSGSCVTIYRVHPISGQLTLVPNDQSCNGFGQVLSVFSPDGRFLATSNFFGTSVSVYSVDPVTGALTEIAGSPFTTTPAALPFAIAYQHDGRFLAVSDVSSQNVSVFAVNLVTGALTLSQTITTTPANRVPDFLAFSADDSLALVGSASNPGSAVVFCVTDGTWCEAPIQTLPPSASPASVAFAPCKDNAAVVTTGDGTTPGFVQVYEVHEKVCPVCP